MLSEIREQAALAVSNPDWFVSELQKSVDNQIAFQHKGDKSRLAQIDKDLVKLERQVNTLFEDRDDGTITKERFKQRLDDLEGRISSFKQERLTIAERLSKIQEVEANNSKFLDLITEYKAIQELDQGLLNRLIERIVVGNKVHLGGKSYSQDVTVYFRFVGAVKMSTSGKQGA